MRSFVVLLIFVGSSAQADPDVVKTQRSVSLADAVRAAVASHPDVTRLKLDTEIADLEVSRQEGAFDPLVRLSAFGRRESRYVPQAEATDTGVNQTDSVGMRGSVDGRTSFGGLYSLNLRGSRNADRGEPGFFIRLVPQYDNLVSLRYTQPLLRDAGTTANRAPVERAKLGADLSRAEQRAQIQGIVLRVVASYWQLVVLREGVSIAEANLAEAVKLRDLVDRQLRAGRGAQSDVTQADVSVAERQQAVDGSVLAVIEGERALLDATYLGKGAIRGNETLVPVDRPQTQPAQREFDRELAVALENRPELKRRDRAIEIARVDEALASNQRKLRLDLYLEAGIAGFAGRDVLPPSLGLSPPPELVQGGFSKSVSNMVGAEAPFFEVGLQIELPLRNRTRAAAAKQAVLSIERERAADVRSLVVHDVRAAYQRIEITSRRLSTATDTVKLAEKNVVAQELRYRGGATILFDVLRAQEQLARARASAALAAAEQEVALMQLEAARGTLLAKFGIK
jgi:outer membrane protein